MSGHSKWSKVKHQKEATDAAKGKIFTKLANAITIAVREGGGRDSNFNFKLKVIIDKARSANMPKEKIERAIERAKGSGEEEMLQEVVYEAFGPSGVGIIIEAATSNKQRTVSDLKNILERGGGTLAASGSVSHLFKYAGLINIRKSNFSLDQVMEKAINAGADDLEDTGDTIEIYTSPTTVHKVKETLESYGLPISTFELFYRPLTTVPISDQHIADQLLKLLSAIEEMEDIQKVFSNFDIPDEFIK